MRTFLLKSLEKFKTVTGIQLYQTNVSTKKKKNMFLFVGTRLGAKDASGIVPFEAVQWLCYRAFIVKLSRHKCTSKCLSGPLKTSKHVKFPVYTGLEALKEQITSNNMFAFLVDRGCL